MENVTRNTGTKRRQTIKTCAIIGVFSALCFVFTSFVSIPYPFGMGYFNLGDGVSLLASLCFGPFIGAAIGSIGGTMSDLFLGYAAFAPFTFVAKGSMCLVSGFVFRKLKGKKSSWASPFLGALTMAAIYLPAYLLLYGYQGAVNSLYDIAQGTVGAILAIASYVPLKNRL